MGARRKATKKKAMVTDVRHRGVRRDRQFQDIEDDEVRVVYYERRGFWIECSYPKEEFTPRKRIRLISSGSTGYETMEFELMPTSIPPFRYVYREVREK